MPDIIYGPKSPEEEYSLPFDFSSMLGVLTQATVSVEVLFGTDPAPSSILSGAAVLAGKIASQRVTGGLPSCVYRIRCTASDGIDTQSLGALLSIDSEDPSLVVETGAGVAGANSYVDIPYLNSYHAARGNIEWMSKSVAEQEAAALRSMAYIETLKHRGQRASVAQSCAYPRVGVITRDGLEWPPNEVPEAYRMAQAEGALREAVKPGTLLPDWEPGKGPKRREKLGDMEDEWFKQDPNEGKYPFQSILRLLGDFIVDPTVDKSKTLYVFDVERA